MIAGTLTAFAAVSVPAFLCARSGSFTLWSFAVQIDLVELGQVVEGYIPSARAFAAMTPTTIDDSFVEAISAFVKSRPLLEWLQSMFFALPEEPSRAEINHVVSAYAKSAPSEAAAESGVSIALILKWLPLILSVLAPLFSRKG